MDVVVRDIGKREPKFEFEPVNAKLIPLRLRKY